PLQQRWRRVKALGKLFHRRLVAERREFRLLFDARWNTFERPLQILGGYFVGRDRGRLLWRKRLPRRAISLACRGNAVGGLHRRQRMGEVGSGISVDLPGGKALAIEQHLKREKIPAAKRRRFAR